MKYAMTKTAAEEQFWQSSPDFNITQNGSYLFWVKDDDGTTVSFNQEITQIDDSGFDFQINASHDSYIHNDLVIYCGGYEGDFSPRAEYSIDGGEWNIGDQCAVEQNCKVKFKVTTNDDKVWIKSYTVWQIDKIKPTISFSTGTEANLIVEVSDFESGISNIRYTLDGGVTFKDVFNNDDTSGFTKGPTTYRFNLNLTEECNVYVDVTDIASNIGFDEHAWTGKPETPDEPVTPPVEPGEPDTPDEPVTPPVKPERPDEPVTPPVEPVPAITNISRNPEKWTNGNVTLTANVNTDSDKYSLIEYSADSGKTWHTGNSVTIEQNGLVQFRLTTLDGIINNPVSIDVDNIDKTAPEIKNITTTTTDITAESVFVDASFSDDKMLVSKLYKINGGDWQSYNNTPIEVKQNGTVYFKAIDAAGNEGVNSYTVNNINPSDDWEDVKQDGPDGNVGDLGIIDHAQALITDGSVGKEDIFDYNAITLEHAAKIRFDIIASDKTKFQVYKLIEKKGNYSLKALRSVSPKKDKISGAYANTTKDLLFTAGRYYISIQSTNKKSILNTNYSINVDGDFFNKAGNNNNWADMKTAGSSGNVGNLGVIDTSKSLITDGWVGFSDKINYEKITLNTAAKLNFNLTATDKTRFAVYSLKENIGGKCSLKTLQNTILKKTKSTDASAASYFATTKDLFLAAGTYYISMYSTNANQGGNAEYSINVEGKFSTKADNSNDKWTSVLDTTGVTDHGVFSGWVGFGDEADFMKLDVSSDGRLSLEFNEATANAVAGKQLNVTCLNDKGKKVSLAFDGNGMISKKTLTAGEYYLGVICTNVKKHETDYSMTFNMLA